MKQQMAQQQMAQVGNKNQIQQRAESTNQNRGFKAFNSDSNVVSVNFNKKLESNYNPSVQSTKIDDNISIEERLRMMEREREQMIIF